MKKIFTFIVALAATVLSANAQAGHGAMTFAGKSNFYVTIMGNKQSETSNVSDTVVYSGTDITMPSMKYSDDMIIPSFTIKGSTFTGGYAGVTWENQIFTATAVDSNGAEKNCTGTFQGTFTHDGGIYKLQLELEFKYGAMPFPITYSIESYYVKEYAGLNSVTVGGQFGPYEADVTHKIRTYVEDEVTKMDVEIPTYQLNGTVMGNLTLGTYTVMGLTYDESKGGYYRDYAADGLTVHLTAVRGGTTTMDADYALSAVGGENILVEMANGRAKITNNFQPGAMPFQIAAIMNQSTSTGIESLTTSLSQSEGASYNLSGQRVRGNAKGIVIKNGRKYFVR